MARTSEMKLHTRMVKDAKQNGVMVNYFYDTHIRLWTAYIQYDDGAQSSCSYDVDKECAISDAVFTHCN